MPRSLLALALVCAMLGRAAAARADGEPDAHAIEIARSAFVEGQALYRQKKWEPALKSFERSFAQVASPNAQLMIARCQRELGRTADAATSYAYAEAEAKRRVAHGEGKYADTATAAGTEGAVVRKDLGQLRIHVSRNEGMSLYVDKKAVPMSRDGDAAVFHEAGSATIQVVDESGNEVHETASLEAGDVVDLAIAAPVTKTPPLDLPAAKPPKKDAIEAKSLPGWFLPATIGAGGGTLVFGGLAVGFGLSSQSTYKSIYATCGPSNCGAAQRDAADSGSRAQTIANVSYVVAAVGLVATAVIVYFGLKSGGVINGPL